MKTSLALAALLAASACASRPRAATITAAPAANRTTTIDLFRNDRAVIELHTQVALQAGPQQLRVALPGRPARLDIGSVQSSAKLISWQADGDDESTATALAVTLVAPNAGNYDVSVQYIVDVQPWRADYRIILQPAAGHALLDATLVLDLPFGLPTGKLFVHDTMQSTGLPITAGVAVGTAVLPAGEHRVPLLPRRTLRATPHVTIDFASTHELAGWATNSTGTPDRTLTAAVTYDLAADDAALAHAPHGAATVYVQTSQQPPVQAAQLRLFEGTEGTPHLRIPLSEIATIKARRHRSEFAYLAARQRVVEQFDFEISNQSDVATNVTIADRAVRGTEWWLGYVNADRVAKTPGTEQDFTLQLRVPARGSRQAMYRIVYSGSQL